jgi:hypothetical protein
MALIALGDSVLTALIVATCYGSCGSLLVVHCNNSNYIDSMDQGKAECSITAYPGCSCKCKCTPWWVRPKGRWFPLESLVRFSEFAKSTDEVANRSPPKYLLGSFDCQVKRV